MRPLGIEPSGLFLKVGPPKVAARLMPGDFGDSVEADDVGEDGVWFEVVADGVLAQTWSARCRMSISVAHEEHLIVGRLLIRSILASNILCQSVDKHSGLIE